MDMKIYRIYFRESFYNENDERVYYPDIYLKSIGKYVCLYAYKINNKYFEISSGIELSIEIIKEAEEVREEEIKEDLEIIKNNYLEYQAEINNELNDIIDNKIYTKRR